MNIVHAHIQKCPNIVEGRSCPYAVLGWDVPLTGGGGGLVEHMVACGNTHAALAIANVQCIQQNNEQLKNDLIGEQTLHAETRKKFEEQMDKRKEMETVMATVKQKYEENSAELSKLRETSEKDANEIRKNLDGIEEKLNAENIRDIGNRFTQLEQQYMEVEGKLHNGSNGISTTASYTADEEIKKGVEKIGHLENGSAVLSANVSELELKLQLLENTCYEGQQLWKVDNVTYRINQAVTGKVTALHSAPCFQKRGGYKFCSRLYLNGDGMGRGTHVSLFFVVMKSEYDALLQWPFAERVTFRLINPHNLDDTTEESFIPDRNSSSFKRPTKDMNIAAGCPMFIKKEILPNYIVDDALYIETKITPTNQ